MKPLNKIPNRFQPRPQPSVFGEDTIGHKIRGKNPSLSSSEFDDLPMPGAHRQPRENQPPPAHGKFEIAPLTPDDQFKIASRIMHKIGIGSGLDAEGNAIPSVRSTLGNAAMRPIRSLGQTIENIKNIPNSLGSLFNQAPEQGMRMPMMPQNVDLPNTDMVPMTEMPF